MSSVMSNVYLYNGTDSLPNDAFLQTCLLMSKMTKRYGSTQFEFAFFIKFKERKRSIMISLGMKTCLETGLMELRNQLKDL